MSTSTFDAVAWPWILTAEGRFSKDPADNGNWTGGKRGVGILRGTKYGIAAHAHPEIEDIEGLTLEQAREIYRAQYWSPLRCEELPVALALLVFDAAVNHGPGRSVKWLQRALRTVVDGAVGAITIRAAHDALPEVVLPELLSWRGAHYALQNDEHHIRGWMARLFRLQLHCYRLAGLKTPTLPGEIQ